jgi:hypothetical protein
MRLFSSIAGGGLLLAALIFHPSTASAAIFWVMLVGVDSSGCGTFPSPFNPCRTLQQAVTNASAGDSIYLDFPADYGPATITKSLNIFARTIGAGTFSPGSPCLTISGANTVVSLSQYTCDQGGAAQPGIRFLAGKALRLSNVTVRGGGGAACGILFQPNTTATLSVQDSAISHFGTSGAGGAVCVSPRSGASVKAWLTNANLQSNQNGVAATATAPSTVQVGIDGTVISKSSGSALRSTGAAATVFARNSTIAANGVGLSHPSGSVISLGGNILVNNTAKGSFTSTQPQQ